MSYQAGELGLPKRKAAKLPPLIPMPELRRYSKPIETRAYALLAYLEAHSDGADANTMCEAFGWGRGQFSSALECAREVLCPPLELTIPHPVPDDGWCYRLTGAWIGVDGTPAIAAGAGYAVAQIEARLRTVLRDAVAARKHLDPQSIDGRKVSALTQHLGHVLGVMSEISGENQNRRAS